MAPNNSQSSIVVTEIPSSGGMTIVASVGPEREPMTIYGDPSTMTVVPLPTRTFLEWLFGKPPSVKEKKYECGHIGPKKYVFHIYGVEYGQRSFRDEPSSSIPDCPYCELEWFREHAFRCCLCGLAVIPNNAVAAYTATSVTEKDYPFKRVGGSALGCLRWNCCPSGGFLSGHWTEKGFKEIDWNKYTQPVD